MTTRRSLSHEKAESEQTEKPEQPGRDPNLPTPKEEAEGHATTVRTDENPPLQGPPLPPGFVGSKPPASAGQSAIEEYLRRSEGKDFAAPPGERSFGSHQQQWGPTPEDYRQASDLVAETAEKLCKAGASGADAVRGALTLFQFLFRFGLREI